MTYELRPLAPFDCPTISSTSSKTCLSLISLPWTILNHPKTQDHPTNLQMGKKGRREREGWCIGFAKKEEGGTVDLQIRVRDLKNIK